LIHKNTGQHLFRSIKNSIMPLDFLLFFYNSFEKEPMQCNNYNNMEVFFFMILAIDEWLTYRWKAITRPTTGPDQHATKPLYYIELINQ
jgi:hypothetical protein